MVHAGHQNSEVNSEGFPKELPKKISIFADWFKGIELVGGLFSISLDY